jgi:spore coat protein U-like protein
VLVATLYSDAGHATVFPTITPGLGLTGSGLTTSVMIYGQIIPSASSPADAYTGSAILTINY